jgi:general secretion pathway protein J
MWRINRMVGTRPIRKVSRGFTLIEILVALAVFSVVAIMAYRGVARITVVKQTLDTDNRKWRDIAVAMSRMEDDFTHVADRSYRDAGGVTQASFRGSAGPLDADGAQLEFVRFDGNRLVHIGYRLNKGTLELMLWDALDLAPRSVPTALPLLEHVQSFDVRFVDKAGAWQLAWPVAANAPQPPRGTEVAMKLESGETITRLFLLP